MDNDDHTAWAEAIEDARYDRAAPMLRASRAFFQDYGIVGSASGHGTRVPLDHTIEWGQRHGEDRDRRVTHHA